MSLEYATLGVSKEVRDRAREEANRRGVTYDRLLRDLLDGAENDEGEETAEVGT